MSATTIDRLVYMANQIARNLAHDADPVAATADHIHAFWTPRMKDIVFAHGSEGMEEVAREAFARLSRGATPAHSTAATDPHAHGSDAG